MLFDTLFKVSPIVIWSGTPSIEPGTTITILNNHIFSTHILTTHTTFIIRLDSVEHSTSKILAVLKYKISILIHERIISIIVVLVFSPHLCDFFLFVPETSWQLFSSRVTSNWLQTLNIAMIFFISMEVCQHKFLTSVLHQHLSMDNPIISHLRS
jgi:hypothetical protein